MSTNSHAVRNGSSLSGTAQRCAVLLIATALICGLLVPGCGSDGTETAAGEGKNVLLIVADALRADCLGCYGAAVETSPNIDRLAREGILFEACRTVVPETLPSFISLLSSRHPKDHGAFSNGMTPRVRCNFVSDIFQRAGYDTAFFVSSYCLTPRFGTSQGFGFFDDELEGEVTLPQNMLIRKAPAVSDAFLDWFGAREGEQSFFAVVHYFDPHFPYVPPEDVARRFVGEDGTTAAVSYDEIVAVRDVLRSAGGKPDEAAERFVNMYRAEISHMDREIGRVLAALKESGALDDTIVIFTADHGETFWDHDAYFSHGHEVYDSSSRIPLIVWAPGYVEEGRRSPLRLSNIDLAPTILGLVNLGVPEEFYGEDLSGTVLDDARRAESGIFAEASAVAVNVPLEELKKHRPNLFNAKSIVQGPWKYIWTPHQANREELYNLTDDPEEKTNLAGAPEHAERIDAMRRRLEAWAYDQSAWTGAAETIPPDVMKKLEALGY